MGFADFYLKQVADKMPKKSEFTSALEINATLDSLCDTFGIETDMQIIAKEALLAN